MLSSNLKTHLRTTLASKVSDHSAPDAERNAAVYGLRMIANYQALMERNDLLDLHKFYLGELYVTRGINGIRASCIGAECASEWMDKPIVLVPQQTLRDLLRNLTWPPPEPTYFTTLVEGFVEAITGTQTDSAARRTRDAVNWTSSSESALVAGALSTASNQTRQAFQNAAGELAYAVPRQLYEEASIILAGRDLRNRRVVGWERGVTIARAVAAVIVGTVVEPVVARGIGGLRSSAMRRIGPRSVGYSRVMMRGMNRTASQRGRTPEAGAAPSDLPDELPPSMSQAQSKQIFLRMDSGELDDSQIPGGRTSGKNPTDSRALMRQLIEEAADHQDLQADFRRLRDGYYQDTDLRLESERLQPKQEGNTCVGANAQRLANQRQGSTESLDDILIDMAQRAPDAFRARWQRAQQRINDGVDDPGRYTSEERVLMVNQRDYYRNRHNDFNSNPVESFMDLFKKEGVPGALFRDLLRARGADIAVVPARLNSRTSLRHIKAMKDRGYDVLVIIDRGSSLGVDSRFHAVTVTGFEFEGGRMTRVKFFEPNLGAEVSMNASAFENMIARKSRAAGREDADWVQSNMTVIKWDSEPWPGTSRPAQ